MTDTPSGMADLTDALAACRALRRANGRPNVVTTADPLDRAIVAPMLGDLIDWLRDRGLLLGPDGLVRAEKVATMDSHGKPWPLDGFELDGFDIWLFALTPHEETDADD